MLSTLMERLTGHKKQVQQQVFQGRAELVRHVASLPDQMSDDALDRETKSIAEALESLGMSQEELDEAVRNVHQRRRDFAIVQDGELARSEIAQIESQVAKLDREHEERAAIFLRERHVLISQSQPLRSRRAIGEEAKVRLRVGCKNQEILAKQEELMNQAKEIGHREIEITNQIPRTSEALSHNRAQQTSLEQQTNLSREDLITQQQQSLDALNQEKADGRSRRDELNRQIAELEQMKLSSEF
jgi:hypothetical protein